MSYRVSFRRDRGLNLGPIGFLIAINVILYIATSLRPSLFISLFGMSRLTFSSQPWTIITNLFIHSPFPEIWHILANMFTLYFFGSFLLRQIGDRRFFTVYFAGGILGNIFFLIFGPQFSVVIGASGAIFAVAGTLAVLSPNLKVFIIPIPVPISLWIAVAFSFLILSFMPGIAWQAHLGGLVSGLAAGYYFRRKIHPFRW